MRVRAHYAYVQKKDWHVGQPSNYYFLDLELRTISAILKNIYIKKPYILSRQIDAPLFDTNTRE